MHHGQSIGGNEKQIEYVKKHVNFTESEGKFGKVGGNNIFSK